MRQPGDQVRLRRLFWDGPEPVTGDLLVTRSGRRKYVVLEVRGPLLDCVVVGADARPEGTANVFEWTWSRRSRAAERGRGHKPKDGE
jgi:hypothetical protein